MKDKKPRRVKSFSEDEILQDLARYKQSALDLGASGAALLSGDKVHVDSRVRIKCCIPKCPEYGSSAHCPPNTLEPDKVKELVGAFRHALLVKVEVPAPVIAGDGGVNENGQIVKNETLAELLRSYRKVNEIVTKIESEAFYDGHYLATAFAAGSCHASLCNFQNCLVLNNQPCRFPLKARPSMEGSSLDVFKMAAEAGWEIYPIGADCKSADVPHGTLVGLVLVE